MSRCSVPSGIGPVFAALAVTLLVTASPAAACTGDCDGSGTVTVDEILLGVNVALGEESVARCSVFDSDIDTQVTVDELLSSVSSGLQGCPEPRIQTVAGTGVAGINGDGLAPLASTLYLPQDITWGPDNELYLADWNNHRIRCLRESGVETVAGTGELGEAANGDALYVQFNHPTNVTFDDQGRMLVAAWHNSLVKRVDFTTGFAETVAGTGARSFGGDGGPALTALLDLPSAVVIDSAGRLVIADQANFRIRRVNEDGTIETICGTGQRGYAGDGGPATAAQLSAPVGQAAPPASRIAIDSEDRIYIADTGNHVVRMIDTDGVIYTIAGTGEPGYEGDGGPAVSARLDTPSDVAVSPNGIVYIADTNNHAVRRIRPDGIIDSVAGTGERGFSGDGSAARDARLDRPYGVEVAPNGEVYVADTHNHRVRRVAVETGPPPPTPVPTPTPEIVPCRDTVGSICTWAGTGATSFNGDGKHRLESDLYWPFDVAFMPSGRTIVLDWNNHRVREVDGDQTLRTIMGTDFVGDGPDDLSDLTPEGADPLTVVLNHPTDLAEFSNGDIALMAWHNHKIRVIDGENGRVRVVLGAGAAYAGDGGPAKDARVNQPPHGVFDAHGNFFLIDQRSQRIRVIYDFDAQRENAIVGTVVGSGVRGFNGDGIALQTQLNLPTGPNPEPSGGIAIDALGRLYFSDTNNNRIRRVEFFNADFTQGIVTTIAGTGTGGFSGDGGPATAAQIHFPQDLEIGPDGNLWFADANNHRVRMIDLTTGIITTVAGTGERGYAGDGGIAVEAQLQRPFGIAFDDAGDLYISDTFNSRVRKVKR
jgi:sugar lactone lactonase YvrE